MRNIILFARQNSTFFLFFLLQLICLRWVIAGNKDRSAAFKNTSNKVAGSFLKKKNRMAEFFILDKMNQKMSEENAALLKKAYQPNTYIPIQDTSYEVTRTDSNAKTQKTIRYNYTAAKVVDIRNNHLVNYITLDKGANHNVKKGESVISTTGIVGRIVNVSKDYCLVRCIVSEKEQASAKIKSGKTGVVSWEPYNTNEAVLRDIPQGAKIKKGDTVYASGFSIYPEDLIIGYILSSTPSPTGTGYNYKIRLATDFHNLHYAYIVHDFIQDNLQQLYDSASVLENEIEQKKLMIQKKMMMKRKLDSLSRVKASIKDTLPDLSAKNTKSAKPSATDKNTLGKGDKQNADQKN